MDLTLYVSTPLGLPGSSLVGWGKAQLTWAHHMGGASACQEGMGMQSYQSKEFELSCKAGSRYTLVMGLEDVQWDKEDSVRGMGERRDEKR